MFIDVRPTLIDVNLMPSTELEEIVQNVQTILATMR